MCKKNEPPSQSGSVQIASRLKDRVTSPRSLLGITERLNVSKIGGLRHNSLAFSQHVPTLA